MASPPKIFISYRRSDSAPYAGRIADALVDRYGEKTVFFDVDSFELGEDFQHTFENAIEDCEVMLVIIGKEWLREAGSLVPRFINRKDSVRIEIARALRTGKTVIPVLVGGAIFPSASSLPEDLREITSRQGVYIDDDSWLQGVQALFRALEYSTDLKPLKARGGFDIGNELRPGRGPILKATPVLEVKTPPTDLIEAQTDPSTLPLVFISHSDKDRDSTEAIVAKLEQSGVRCWVSYRDIPPGEPSWSGFIVSAIAKSQLMVIVLTEHSVNSTHVQNEVALAVDEKVAFIPFRLDHTPLPASLRYFFSTPQSLDVSRLSRTEALNSLTTAVQKRLGN